MTRQQARAWARRLFGLGPVPPSGLDRDAYRAPQAKRLDEDARKWAADQASAAERRRAADLKSDEIYRVRLEQRGSDF